MRFQLLFYILSLFIINGTLNAQNLTISYNVGYDCSFGKGEDDQAMRGACETWQEISYKSNKKRGALLAKYFKIRNRSSKYEDGDFSTVSDKTKKRLVFKLLKRRQFMELINYLDSASVVDQRYRKPKYYHHYVFRKWDKNTFQIDKRNFNNSIQ